MKSKKRINVVFFAANLSMWRYQRLYELMSKHDHFNVSIVITAFSFYSVEEQKKHINELKSFFDSKGISYVEATKCNVKIELNPDILFYPHYYFDVLDQNCDAKKFKNRLLCAYPYGFNNVYKSFAYNDFFHNAAWKLFYPTQSSIKDAQHLAYNKGKNIVVTGYPNADYFASNENNNVWKKQSKEKKRIIWAPHFTITQGVSPLFFSTFLSFNSVMQSIAIKYSDDIQFAFKPHPRLRAELYKFDDWGKARTDEYYNWWDEQNNTQLETGNFIDLFKQSDAMIHDCGSFSIEYFYTKKPIMYLCRDIEEIKKEKNEVGIKALNAHYTGNTEHDIVMFIENVVLKNNDSMKQMRELFYDNYLKPPFGRSVAQNTLNDILESLGIN